MSKLKKAQRNADLLSQIADLNNRLSVLERQVDDLHSSNAELSQRLTAPISNTLPYPNYYPNYPTPIHVGDVPPFNIANPPFYNISDSTNTPINTTHGPVTATLNGGLQAGEYTVIRRSDGSIERTEKLDKD